jgi:hypothetical protein
MPFDLSDYVTVDERIQLFYKHHKDGRLQTREVRFCEWPQPGILAVAEAYRTADDPHPGVGTAWEPVPGKTQFTRDSEVQNAETAAWGRAIVALGIGSKPGQLASREEVEARQPDKESAAAPAVSNTTAVAPPAVPTAAAPSAAADEHQRAHETKSTLDVSDPDRRKITTAQRRKLFALAKDYNLLDDEVRSVVERITGSRSTAEIQRWKFEALLAAIELEGRGAEV